MTAACFVLALGVSGTQGPRNLLTGALREPALAAALLPAAQWHPYPTIRDRTDWEAVPQEIRAGFIREAQQYLHTTWDRIPATVTLQYIRDGNRSHYDAMNTRQREKLATLVMAEVFENQGRFLDDIANGIWAISEQTFWGSTAHLGMQRAGSGLPDVTEPIVDLFAGETAALLAWTDYLLGDKLDQVSPLVRKRIRAEVDRRVLTPALARDDFWWMGFGERKNLNNWNPWINSNWLAAVLLLEADPQRRAASVYKIMRSLDNFINSYPDDGASDEGPGYWDRARRHQGAYYQRCSSPRRSPRHRSPSPCSAPSGCRISSSWRRGPSPTRRKACTWPRGAGTTDRAITTTMSATSSSMETANPS
jgi:hypothetical protein